MLWSSLRQWVECSIRLISSWLHWRKLAVLSYTLFLFFDYVSDSFFNYEQYKLELYQSSSTKWYPRESPVTKARFVLRSQPRASVSARYSASCCSYCSASAASAWSWKDDPGRSRNEIKAVYDSPVLDLLFLWVKFLLFSLFFHLLCFITTELGGFLLKWQYNRRKSIDIFAELESHLTESGLY